jgi:alkanesulfonate monooxygenase SsuD/methylene tetrahydromethanopterin reductase-like flavin-dependent oxidoreductase (luciferase family)
MKIGAGFFTCQHPGASGSSWSQLYSDLARHARTAESAGLDSFWLAEHHFSPDGYLTSPLVAAAAVAAVTTRLELGCEVAPAFYHPVRLAEDAICVDLISRGRLTLGLARSYRPEEFAGYGLDPAPEAETERLETAVGVLRRAFAGAPVSPAGAGGGRLVLAPMPAGSGPRLLLGFHGDPAEEAARAARLGALYRTDPSWPLERALEMIALYDAESRRVGEAPADEVIVFCYGFVSGDSDPWSVIADGFAELRATYDRWRGARPTPVSRDDQRLLLGDVAAVGVELARYRELVGDRLHVVLRLAYPGMTADRVDAGIRDLGAVATVLRGMR